MDPVTFLAVTLILVDAIIGPLRLVHQRTVSDYPT